MWRSFRHPALVLALCGLASLLSFSSVMAQGPTPAARQAFQSYADGVEARLARQHLSPEDFLALHPLELEAAAHPRGDEAVFEPLSPVDGPSPPGALLHHWRGTAFAPGAKAPDLERLLRDVPAYQRSFAPEVLQARVLTQTGDDLRVSLRVRQRHGLTVVLDTAYAVHFGRLDARHGYSVSRSTGIAEVGSPGTPDEHLLSPAQDHGFLWRQNTYWSWEERDGGLFIQVESVSLSRSIPAGLGWAVRPFVATVPREALAFTLRSACAALRSSGNAPIAPALAGR